MNNSHLVEASEVIKEAAQESRSKLRMHVLQNVTDYDTKRAVDFILAVRTAGLVTLPFKPKFNAKPEVCILGALKCSIEHELPSDDFYSLPVEAQQVISICSSKFSLRLTNTEILECMNRNILVKPLIINSKLYVRLLCRSRDRN